MGNNDLLSNMHFITAFYPVADAFSNGITTDAVSLANYKRATLLICTGAIEDAGISNLVTVEACTTAAGASNTAMAFRSRVCSSSTSVDTWSAAAARASTGYNFAAAFPAANVMWELEVTAAEVAAAVSGGLFVRAVIAETANKTITAGGIWILSEPRFPNSVPLTAIV
jgi:hypothetical protein